MARVAAIVTPSLLSSALHWRTCFFCTYYLQACGHPGTNRGPQYPALTGTWHSVTFLTDYQDGVVQGTRAWFKPNPTPH